MSLDQARFLSFIFLSRVDTEKDPRNSCEGKKSTKLPTPIDLTGSEGQFSILHGHRSEGGQSDQRVGQYIHVNNDVTQSPLKHMEVRSFASDTPQ